MINLRFYMMLKSSNAILVQLDSSQIKLTCTGGAGHAYPSGAPGVILGCLCEFILPVE